METFVEVRRRKEVPFFQVDNDVMDYDIFDDIYEKMAYIALCRLSNQKDHAFPSHKTLAKICYCGVTKIKEVLNRLEEKMLIDMVRNRYGSDGSRLSNLIYINEIPTSLLGGEDYFFKKAPSRVAATPQSQGDQPPSRAASMGKSRGDYKQEQHKKNNKKKNNTTNKEPQTENPSSVEKTVVVEISELESFLQTHEIKVNKPTLDKWRSLDTDKHIVLAAQEALQRPNVRNVVGYITKMLEHGYEPSETPIELPSYIVDKFVEKDTSISREDQIDTLELLFKLGEINRQEYEQQLSNLE